MSDTASQYSETQPFVPVSPEPEVIPTEAVPTAAVQPGTSRPRGGGWVNVVLALAIAVAIGGIGFAAGRMTAPASTTAAGSGRFGNGAFPGANGGANSGANVPGGGFPGGGFGGDDGGLRSVFASGASIKGTVESVSASSLTLKLASGQTIQIALNGSTTYHSQAAATSSDVQTGGTVIVRLQLLREQGAAAGQATDVTLVP